MPERAPTPTPELLTRLRRAAGLATGETGRLLLAAAEKIEELRGRLREAEERGVGGREED